jgi:hypothetical protein
MMAQRGNGASREDFEKFKAEREEYISKAMGLTDSEKAAFWPIANELQAKKFELYKPLREKQRAAGRDASEAQYKEILELQSQIKAQEAKLDQEYLTKFLKVITAAQVAEYYRADQQYGEEMLKRRGPRGDRR